MPLIVQKYGGTSVGSPGLIRRVAERVAAVRASGSRVAVVVSAMGDSTDRLVDLAAGVCRRPVPRELDALLATGEQVSITLLAMALADIGCPARSYTGPQLPIRTSGTHGRARIESIGVERIEADLEAGVVPIVAGFQGIAEDGSITTIGRGGSDTTAVALAVAVRAEECQILTDVDGVYTTDPRVVPTARRLARLTFDEMLELAGQGSRVLHLRCVEFARKYGMSLRVASSHVPGPGTLIDGGDSAVEAPIVSGIAFNADEASVTIAGVPAQAGVTHALLAPLADSGIEVDMIVMTAARDGTLDVSFTVHRRDHDEALERVAAASAAFPGARVAGQDRLGKVAIVGVGIRSHTGVAVQLLATLARERIEVLMLSTSEIKIAVVIAASDLERAVRALHDEFKLAIGESC
jgi:aspartate kinase